MATKRRTETNIRRELIYAELERLRKENATLRQSRARLARTLKRIGNELYPYNRVTTWKSVQAAMDLRAEDGETIAILRSLLHEFLSTHCAPLELRARATAAVGKPPLEFGKKEEKR